MRFLNLLWERLEGNIQPPSSSPWGERDIEPEHPRASLEAADSELSKKSVD